MIRAAKGLPVSHHNIENKNIFPNDFPSTLYLTMILLIPFPR